MRYLVRGFYPLPQIQTIDHVILIGEDESPPDDLDEDELAQYAAECAEQEYWDSIADQIFALDDEELAALAPVPPRSSAPDHDVEMA
jgi:hypothetical protein